MQAVRAKLEDYIIKYLKLWDFYGVIQVIQKGEVLVDSAYGYASIEFSTRFSGNLHIELYPVGEGRFAQRYYDQIDPYTISENENGEKIFFGYIRNSS